MFVAKPESGRVEGHWSWHLLRTWSRAPGVAVTVCGRRIKDAVEHAGLPAGRSCESCLRMDAAHRETEA